MLFKTVSMFTLAFFISTASALAVHDGTDSDKLGIGMLTKADGTTAGTGAEIAERCILTVAHHSTTMRRYYQKQKPFNGAGRKFIVAMRDKPHPLYAGANREDQTYVDLALLWTKPYGCDYSTTVYTDCAEGDAEKFDPTWTVLNVATGLPDNNTESLFYGYGLESPNAGVREKREGEQKVALSIDHVTAGKGSVIKSVPRAGDVRSCPGDSGAPHIEDDDDDDTIFGVNRDGNPEGCDDTTDPSDTIVVGFNNGNEDFVKLTGTGVNAGEAAKFCRKKAKKIKVKKEDSSGSSTQNGQVKGDHEDDVTLVETLDVIDCGSGCSEEEYTGPNGEGFIIMHLDATDDDFVEWIDGGVTGEGLCPCDGTTNPLCTIEAQHTDWDQESQGMTCIAVFEPASPAPQPVK